MRRSDILPSSETGKIKLIESSKQAKLTIEELAAKANVSQDTIKRLRGTKDFPNGVERWQITNMLKF